MYNLEKNSFISVDRLCFKVTSCFNLKFADTDFRKYKLDPVDELEIPDDYEYGNYYVIQKGDTVLRPNSKNNTFYLVIAIYNNNENINRSFVEVQELDNGNPVGETLEIPLSQAKNMEFSSLGEYMRIIEEERVKEEAYQRRKTEQQKRNKGKFKNPFYSF